MVEGRADNCHLRTRLADADLQHRVERPAVAADRGRQPDFAALINVARLEAVCLRNHAARRKGQLAGGENQRVVQFKMVVQLLIAIAGREIDLHVIAAGEIPPQQQLGRLQLAGRLR